jgi:hypothetical protein
MELDEVKKDKHELQELITNLIAGFEVKHNVVVKKVDILELPQLTAFGRPATRKARLIIDF